MSGASTRSTVQNAANFSHFLALAVHQVSTVPRRVRGGRGKASAGWWGEGGAHCGARCSTPPWCSRSSSRPRTRPVSRLQYTKHCDEACARRSRESAGWWAQGGGRGGKVAHVVERVVAHHRGVHGRERGRFLALAVRTHVTRGVHLLVHICVHKEVPKRRALLVIRLQIGVVDRPRRPL